MHNLNDPMTQAAANIIDEMGIPPTGTARIVHAEGKTKLAETIGVGLEGLGVAAELVAADALDSACLAARLASVQPDIGQVILLDHRHASVLFRAIGRPDLGIRVPTSHLFCDWLMPLDGTVRTYCVDRREHTAFRGRLHAALGGALEVQIRTRQGTDITVSPRHWIDEWGEVFTAVHEGVANGRIVVDGSIYYGLPPTPIVLEIRDGQVTNLGDLDPSDEQQRLLLSDLSTDSQASLLAELGLGVNLGASRAAPNMEAEQCRGTIHFDFGHNLGWGGRNRSDFHGGGVLMEPTIIVNGKTICRDGAYRF